VRHENSRRIRAETSVAQQYEPVHAVAHWDDASEARGKLRTRDYENAGKQAEQLSARGRELARKLLNSYGRRDLGSQDECRSQAERRCRLILINSSSHPQIFFTSDDHDDGRRMISNDQNSFQRLLRLFIGIARVVVLLLSDNSICASLIRAQHPRADGMGRGDRQFQFALTCRR